MYTWKKIRNWNMRIAYRLLLKPLFFQLDPERVHQWMIHIGNYLGRFWFTRAFTRFTFYFSDPRLAQTIHGIHFTNPIGLAGGFDKNAHLTNILPDVGFGFMEVGSITAHAFAGNLGTHLWRLPKTKSLVVNYGLLNDGADAIATRLERASFRIPVGINIAKTNNQETCDLQTGVSDYAYTLNRFRHVGSFDTINVSCPNAFGGQPFHEPERLEALLTTLNLRHSKKPAFIKISPDLDGQTIDKIVDLAITYGASGIICTNLTKKRDPHILKDAHIPTVGGLSGKAVGHLSDACIQRIYQRAGNKLTIIACGGVFNAEDAYRKIKLGASLIELITGMIYEGPQLISEINLGLIAHLEQDGYKNISQAIGTMTHC